ncbi:cell division protein ZapA [Clostridioides difficile]
MNTVTVTINGVEYNLRGKEDEKYLLDVAAYVDTKIREISGSNKKLSTSSAAVLTAVNIADELFKCDLEIGNITKKKNSLEERHLTLKERLRELKVEIDETAKARINEVESLKNVIFNMEEKLKDLENLKSANEELNNKLVELMDTNKKNESLINELQSELTTVKEENEKLETTVKNCTEEINSRVSIEEYDEVINKLQKTQKINVMLSDENDDLREKVSNYNNEINSYSSENTELKELEKDLKEKIKFKEAELEEYKLLNEKNSIEERNSMENKIINLETELENVMNKKETYRLRNKEMNFKLQNYKYKVLDLEKKLMDAQFNLAVEKRDKNPLLR